MSVVFSRAPLRISLGGGGTDLPSYYSEHGGFLIAGAIDKYVYMLIHTVFQRRYRMKYSVSEEVEDDRRDPASDTPRDAEPPLARQPARDRDLSLTSRPEPAWVPPARSRSRCSRVSPTRVGPRPRPVRSPSPRATSRSTCSRRTAASRTPTFRRTEGCAHTRSRRTGRSRWSRWSSREDAARAARESAALLHRQRAGVDDVLADQDQRTRGGDEDMLQNLHRTKEMGYRAASSCSTATCSPTPS